MRNNDFGNSIIMVLIALSLTSFLALAISSIITIGEKGNKSIQIRSDFRNYSNLIEKRLLSTSFCTQVFKNLAHPTTESSKVSDLVLKVGSEPWLYPGLAVQGFKISQVSLDGWNELGNNYGLSKLKIKGEISFNGGVIGPIGISEVSIPILLVSNGSGKIISCFTENSAAYNCLEQGGEMINPSGSAFTKERCMHPGNYSGTVVWVKQLATGALLGCQYADSNLYPETNLQSTNAAYCTTSHIPCCRKGFKRSRLGEWVNTAESKTEQTFTCYFVHKTFCAEPGINGCECN